MQANNNNNGGGATLATLTLVLIILAAICYDGVDLVPEGHVGVYWRGGRLMEEINYPGVHAKVPFLDRGSHIQTTMQTDSVTEIPCGTSGGVMVYFDRIEVVNRLDGKHVLETMRQFGSHYDQMWIFDKIHHEINQFCSSHTLREVFIELFDTLDENLQKALQASCDKYDTGIEIITVRVTKPRIPESVKRNYELIEGERAALDLAVQQRKKIENQAETEAKKREIQATMEKNVRAIEVEKEIKEKEGLATMKKLDNEMFLSTEKAKADASLYHAQKTSEANKLKLTPEYLELMRFTSIANNTKIFFGSSIPAMFASSSDAVAQQATVVGKN